MNRRQILRNFGFLATGKTLGDVFTFILFVALSRAFGQEGIGRYSFAMAFTGFFAIFADFGLQGFSIRELSRLTDSIGAHYGRHFQSLRFVLSIVALVLLLAAVPLLPFATETKVIVILLGVYQLLYRLADGLAAVFVAREQPHVAGLLEAATRAVTGGIGVTVILSGGPLVAAVATLPIIASLQLAVAYWAVTRRYGKPRITTSPAVLRKTARGAVPHAASLFLSQIYSRIDVVFLGFMIGEAAAGLYNIEYRVVFVLLFIPHFAAVALFPQASSLYLESKGELRRLFNEALRLAWLIGLPASAGLWLIATDLIQLIYGEQFAEAGTVLRLLAWLLLLAFVSRISLTVLISCNEEVAVAKRQSFAALVNVAGNLALIPVLGVIGAAIATLASESLLILLLLRRLSGIVGWPRIASPVAIGAFGTASFCIPFTLATEVPLFLVVPMSAVLYVLTISAFKDVRRNELRAVWDLIRS